MKTMSDETNPKGGATASPGDDVFDAARYLTGDFDLDLAAMREALLKRMGGDKRNLFRAMYISDPPPATPAPEEAIEEEAAVPCLDDLRRRFGDARVLDCLTRALLEMGDLASTLMVARAELVSRDQQDSYRYEPRERMPKTDWRTHPETSVDFRQEISRADSYLDETHWFEPTGRKPVGKNPKQFTDFRDSKLGQTKFGKPK